MLTHSTLSWGQFLHQALFISDREKPLDLSIKKEGLSFAHNIPRIRTEPFDQNTQYSPGTNANMPGQDMWKQLKRIQIPMF